MSVLRSEEKVNILTTKQNKFDKFFLFNLQKDFVLYSVELQVNALFSAPLCSNAKSGHKVN